MFIKTCHRNILFVSFTHVRASVLLQTWFGFVLRSLWLMTEIPEHPDLSEPASELTSLHRAADAHCHRRYGAIRISTGSSSPSGVDESLVNGAKWKQMPIVTYT